MAIKISGSTIIDDSRNIVSGAAATFTGNVTIGGTLTYEDVTNIDSIGIITARSGVIVPSNDKSVAVGAGGVFQMIRTTTHGSQLNTTDGGDIRFRTGGTTRGRFYSTGLEVVGRILVDGTLEHRGDPDTSLGFPATDTISFTTAGAERLRIDSSGNIVFPGSINQLNITGVSTFAGNIVANGNIVGDTATTISGIAGVTAKPTAVDTDIFSIIRSDHASSKLFRIFQDSTSGGGAGGPHINTFNRNLMITASTSAATDSGLYLRTQGQLGIGTNNPTSKLDVVGDVKVSGVVTATNFVGNLSGIATGATRVYLDESEDDNAFYNIPFLDSTGPGDRHDALQVDHAGLMFNPGTNRLVVNRIGPTPSDQHIHFDIATSEKARINSSGNFGINNTSPTSKLDVGGDAKISGVVTATDFDATSDIRLKTNVQPIEDPIAKVIQIEGVSFNWKKDNRPALGVIADQVEKVLPQLVHGDDPKTVNYNGLVGLLIEVVKDQQKQIDTLSERLSKLE